MKSGAELLALYVRALRPQVENVAIFTGYVRPRPYPHVVVDEMPCLGTEAQNTGHGLVGSRVGFGRHGVCGPALRCCRRVVLDTAVLNRATLRVSRGADDENAQGEAGSSWVPTSQQQEKTQGTHRSPGTQRCAKPLCGSSSWGQGKCQQVFQPCVLRLVANDKRKETAANHRNCPPLIRRPTSASSYP